MRDRLFFPLAGLLVLLMVGLAVQPGIGQLPTGSVAGDGLHYDRIVIDGAYLNKVIAGGNARTRLQRAPERGYVLEVAAEEGALPDAPNSWLAPDIEVLRAEDPRHGPGAPGCGQGRDADESELFCGTCRRVRLETVRSATRLHRFLLRL